MIRIAGGEFKGRLIKIPKTSLTRVTTSYSRKVIFDTLMAYLLDATVLDLYAGSGSLGIEALSRGAKTAFFVDTGSKQITTIKENISLLKLNSKSTIIKQDAIQTLQKWNHEQLDLIFIDPPYSLSPEEIGALLIAINDHNLLKDSGVICLEVSSRSVEEIKKTPLSSLKVFKEKKRGGTTLLFIN